MHIAKHEITEQKLANVVGILPGKSKKDEYVIFSGHYDHIGVGKACEWRFVFIMAPMMMQPVLQLLSCWQNISASLKNNERTLVFAAFTAEEIGGFGSQYFSQQFDAE